MLCLAAYFDWFGLVWLVLIDWFGLVKVGLSVLIDLSWLSLVELGLACFEWFGLV